MPRESPTPSVPILFLLVWSVLCAETTRASELTPCRDVSERAECGSLSVPENPAVPDGRRIDLKVVVLRSEEPGDREPVFLLAGGPGQAASQLARLATGPLEPVNRSRDFVMVDHRGTGGSNPVDCPVDVDADPSLAFGQLFDPKMVGECLEEAKKRADVTLYTSRYAVRDLEAVRKWLGYRKVILWGGSGGTRTGLVYMREFPSSIVAASFDGLVPPDSRIPSGFAPAAQRALNRVFEDCAQQPTCAAAYPRLEEAFQRLLSLFADGPVETTFETNDRQITVSMHRGDFAYAVRGILYNSGRTARLPAMIHRAAASGDLTEFASAHWRRSAAVLPSIALGVHFGVYCAEDIPFIERDRIEEATRSSFLQDYLLEQYGNACKAWESRPEPASFTDPVRSDIPVLMFSGRYDPSTPDGTAEATAEHLSNSRHIVAPNEGQGAQWGCARPLAIQFLERATLEGLGPACEEVGPIEFEIPEVAATTTGSR